MEGGSCDDQHQHLLIISEDVLIQILLWLPVISLLRFKSVCKPWRSIIESTFFIHLHRKAFRRGGFVCCSGSGSNCSGLINLGVEEKKGKILTLSGEEFEFFKYLGTPGEGMEVMSVGCCDGIICIHYVFTRNVALWNPAIKQSRTLPKPSNLLGNPDKICFGGCDDSYWAEDFVRFGIDIKTNDYKVLLITTYKLTHSYGIDLPRSQYPHERRVHVYSLSTDSWKCIDDATLSAAHHDLDIDIKFFFNHNQGLYLNGSFFFTADYFDEDMPLLLSFDFAEEIFRTIQPPFDLRSNFIFGYVYFIPFGENNFALIYAKKEDSFHDCVAYDIWVLNEQHGVKEPWTKFYTIGPPDNLPNEPLFITNNGEFAITYGWYWQDDREQDVPKLQLLNLITGEKKLLRRDFGSINSDFVHVYKPSLMPIGGNGATPT